MKKKKQRAYMIGVLIFMFISVIFFMWLAIKTTLSQAGIKIPFANFLYVFFISVILWSISVMLRELKILKTNHYFTIAIILSWIVLFTGFTFYAHIYKVEVPFQIPYHIQNNEDMSKFTNSDKFYNIICSSLRSRDYFSEWDNYQCNISADLKSSGYEFYKIHIDKTLKNMNFTNYDYFCPYGNLTCSFNLYTLDDAFAFSITPMYIKNDSTEVITPIYYYFEIQKLRNWKDIENLEQNKITLLIAIITASFLSVWAVIYYAKKILENK